ncbi:MAG: YegS/Rv2252/BmrU family lipid kinase [bacterium]|nr:YegS/Rv2252/BmrU family lipid kinase [bacterium]
MKKAIIIYNPNSGKFSIRKKRPQHDFDNYKQLFAKHGYEVNYYQTKYSRHAKEIVKNLEDDIDLVISVGGDGTYNEVMTGNFERKKKLTLSHLPYGTTNDVGAMLGLGKNLNKNLELILTGEVHGIDVCTINGQPFTYSAGFGKFMNVPYETSRKMKKTIGHLAYILEAIRDFFHKKTPLYEITYEVNNERYHGLYSFALISNANRIAGFNNFYHNIKLNDNKFEVLFCNLTTKKDIVKSLFYLTTNDITKVPGFYFHQTDHLKITFHNCLKKPWCLDGEKFDSSIVNYQIDIVHNIPIMVPKKVLPKLFIEEEK